MSYKILEYREGCKIIVYYMYTLKDSIDFCYFTVYFYKSEEKREFIIEFLDVNGDSFVIEDLKKVIPLAFEKKEYSFIPEKNINFLSLPEGDEDDEDIKDYSDEIDDHLSHFIKMIESNKYESLIISFQGLFCLDNKKINVISKSKKKKFISKNVLEEIFLKIIGNSLLEPENNILPESYKMHIYYLLVKYIEKMLITSRKFMLEIMETNVEEKEKFHKILRKFQEMTIPTKVDETIFLLLLC